MKTIHDLFEEDTKPFHDVVASVTHLSLSDEKLKRLFKKLPTQTQGNAYNYGFKDNLFQAQVERFLLGEHKLEDLLK